LVPLLELTDGNVADADRIAGRKRAEFERFPAEARADAGDVPRCGRRQQRGRAVQGLRR